MEVWYDRSDRYDRYDRSDRYDIYKYARLKRAFDVIVYTSKQKHQISMQGIYPSSGDKDLLSQNWHGLLKEVFFTLACDSLHTCQF